MARTDDDSWDITESVGSTALGVAMARARENSSSSPLFTDAYAQLFVDAAVARGWEVPHALTARIESIAGYAASRTRWFDDFFITAGAHGITQAVILAAGLDARAWRLPWITETVLYEIDQPKVLQFKTATLTDDGVRPRVSSYRTVAVDLRANWPKALQEAGFDASRPTAWSAEGLLPYLPPDGQNLLFERLTALSAPDSRVAVEAFGADFFDPGYQQRRREQVRRLHREAGQDPDQATDVADLWYLDERADVSEWLTGHGWTVNSVEAQALMSRYGRLDARVDKDMMPKTVFVEGLRAR